MADPVPAPTVDREACVCTPHPFGDGPQEDCEVHGEWRAELIRQRDEARAEVSRQAAVIAQVRELTDGPFIAGQLRRDLLAALDGSTSGSADT